MIRPTLHALPAAIASLLLAGCTTVGPDYHVPAQAVALQANVARPFQSAQEAAFSPAALAPQWWRLYQDPVLDNLIAQAFTANTDLRIAAANLARVRAILDQTEQAGKPQVGLNLDPGYGRASATALAQPAAFPTGGYYDAGVSVSYQVDLFGQLTRAIEAAHADIDAAVAAADLAHVTVAAETTRAYVEACAAGQQLQVAQASLDLQNEFVQLTAQRIRLGRGTALDGSRAQGQLEQLRAALAPLQAQRRVAGFKLAVLTGQVPGVFNQLVAQCDATPQVQHPIPVGDGAMLIRRRPDIRQAERQLASASARIGVATAELYPNISVGMSAGSTGLTSEFGATPSLRWGLGPLISWSLPSSSTAHSKIKQAEAGSAAALAHFDATVLNALRETESALTLYARELDRHAALSAARAQARLAAQQARQLYRLGRTDFLTTLDADRTLAQSETLLALSAAHMASGQVNLFFALGGGWEAPNFVQSVKKVDARLRLPRSQ